MKVFYARVSTVEQNEDRQITMAKEQGIDVTDDQAFYLDKLSGKDTKRPRLNDMLSFVRKGDTVIVESYSRLSRNTADLLTIIDKLNKKGVAFVSLKEKIDTSTPAGRFMLNVFASLAQFEREQMKQRQAEGIAEAKKKGKYFGRQPIKVDEKQFADEVQKWIDGKQTAVETMKKLKLKPNSFYRKVKERGYTPPTKPQRPE